MSKFNSAIFIEAQDKQWNSIASEMIHHKKETHWIWFVFPNIIGLGTSDNAVKYAIQNIRDVKRYWSNDKLRKRMHFLLDQLLLTEKPVLDVMGSEIDVIKLSSCLTLFSKAIPYEKKFNDVMEHLKLEEHQETLDILESQNTWLNKLMNKIDIYLLDFFNKD